MRGLVTPLFIWSLASLPLWLGLCRSRGKTMAWAGAVVAVGGLVLWVATAGLGYRVTENLSGSLNGHLYVHRAGEVFRKGDLVAFRWKGDRHYPAGTVFIKRVAGWPGEHVRREGRAFWIGDAYIGLAKPFSKAGVALEPAAEGVIPAGQYFVATEHADSLDSRYALVGTLPQHVIIGRAHELF